MNVRDSTDYENLLWLEGLNLTELIFELSSSIKNQLSYKFQEALWFHPIRKLHHSTYLPHDLMNKVYFWDSELMQHQTFCYIVRIYFFLSFYGEFKPCSIIF